jgi:hypothetical protein
MTEYQVASVPFSPTQTLNLEILTAGITCPHVPLLAILIRCMQYALGGSPTQFCVLMLPIAL